MSDKIERVARSLCHEWAKPMGDLPEFMTTGETTTRVIADAESKLWIAFEDKWKAMAKAAIEEALK